MKTLEAVHIKFKKTLLVNRSTTNIMIRAETGRYPLITKSRILNFIKHIKEQGSNRSQIKNIEEC